LQSCDVLLKVLKVDLLLLDCRQQTGHHHRLGLEQRSSLTLSALHGDDPRLQHSLHVAETRLSEVVVCGTSLAIGACAEQGRH
jgi:hypothetical protein